MLSAANFMMPNGNSEHIRTGIPANPTTTQKAFLERFLARQRTRRVRPHVHGRIVLDFGCGAHAWAARELSPLCKRIDGVEPTIEPCYVDGIRIMSSLEQVQDSDYDLVLALAVFEHLNPKNLRCILQRLSTLTRAKAQIVGTIPTPLARPVLEFLSYRLGVVDASQISDHKVYYDELWLQEVLSDTPWELYMYQTFQMGLNGFFALNKRP